MQGLDVETLSVINIICNKESLLLIFPAFLSR